MSERIAERLRGLAEDMDTIASAAAFDPDAIGLIESVIGIFGEDWWKAQSDRRLAAWYERAQAYLAVKHV